MAFTKSEKDIMATWNLEKYSIPLITIECMTFNHEKYIEDAIVGFLSQVTEFPFEIYIHDDCSNDDTAYIIKQYEKKYPRIIHAVCEKENQYSKGSEGTKRFEELRQKYCKYKYEAVCEGDDYWIDSLKLQKQIDYMENHEDCSLTFTNGKVLDLSKQVYTSLIDSGLFDKDSEDFASHNQIITLNNFYMLEFPPTASHIFRRSCIKDVEKDMSSCIAGDLKWRLYALTKGYAYYFHDVTCVYRRNVPGSATTNWKKYDKKQLCDAAESYIRMLNEIDRLSGFSYSDSIWKLKIRYVKTRMRNSNNFNVLFVPENRKAFSQASFIEKVKVIVKILMPNAVIRLMYKVRNK